MPKYDVQIREVHYVTVRVTAGSPALAKEAAHTMMEAGLDELDVEYSHTMEEHEWGAVMVPEKKSETGEGDV